MTCASCLKPFDQTRHFITMTVLDRDGKERVICVPCWTEWGKGRAR